MFLGSSSSSLQVEQGDNYCDKLTVCTEHYFLVFVRRHAIAKMMQVVNIHHT